MLETKMRPYRIEIPLRLVKFIAKYYDVSEANALTIIRARRSTTINISLTVHNLIRSAWRRRYSINAYNQW